MVVPRAPGMPLHDEKADWEIVGEGHGVRATKHGGGGRSCDRGGVGRGGGILGACMDDERWSHHSVSRILQYLPHC